MSQRRKTKHRKYSTSNGTQRRNTERRIWTSNDWTAKNSTASYYDIIIKLNAKPYIWSSDSKLGRILSWVTFKVGLFEVRSFEVQSFEVRSFEVRSFKIRSFEVQLVNSPTEFRTTELCTTQLGTSELRKRLNFEKDPTWKDWTLKMPGFYHLPYISFKM